MLQWFIFQHAAWSTKTQISGQSLVHLSAVLSGYAQLLLYVTGEKEVGASIKEVLDYRTEGGGLHRSREAGTAVLVGSPTGRACLAASRASQVCRYLEEHGRSATPYPALIEGRAVRGGREKDLRSRRACAPAGGH